MIPKQREYEILGMGQTRIYIYVVMLPLLHPFSSCYLFLMQTELSKKYPVKVVPHRPAQNERRIHCLRRFFDSQIIPLRILIALYQTTRNEVIAEKHTSFLYKY